VAAGKGQSAEATFIEGAGGLGAAVGLLIAATGPRHAAKLNCPRHAVGQQQGACLGHAITGTVMPYVIAGLLGLVIGGAVAIAMLLLWRATRSQLRRKSSQRPARAGDSTTTGDPRRRQPVPERVRHEVWRRDRGTCVDCGSRERLEFDHIIPVSKGGANTARNLELRCEGCNQRKGARI
jgi:hypothetical protein